MRPTCVPIFACEGVLAGLAVPTVGLTVVAYVYGTAVIAMALARGLSARALSTTDRWHERAQSYAL